MYIYNITTNINEEAHAIWLEWMRKIHIPAMLETGKFIKAKLLRVMVHEEMGGITYSTQYFCKSTEKLKEYYREDAPKLNGEIKRVFPNQFAIFATELEIIDEINFNIQKT